ncbi:MAG TPA: T9SS type A sorting domain-containing protein, partial [Flavisolibacter sp.]|nr:T9SS type A sorting domain-containing protein [Flavisolibacter sp.]
NKLYALLASPYDSIQGIRLTTDGGVTWSAIDVVKKWCDQGDTSSSDFSRGQAWYDLTIATPSSNDSTVFVGGVDIFKSTNSGSSWSQATQWAIGCSALPVVHADIHSIKFFPGSANDFIVSCDGGIYYTNNGGSSFVSKNPSYNVTQYYSLALHPAAGSNYILAGSQDNGTHKFTATGINSVTTVVGGDGTNCFIDGDNPNYQYASNPGGIYYFSSNGGLSFNWVGNYDPNGDRFINPADYDSTIDYLYCGGAKGKLDRFHNFTSSISLQAFSITITPNLSISTIKVDPNTKNRVWIAFSTADNASAYAIPELYIMDNANSNSGLLTNITLPANIAIPGSYISSIDVEPGNANHIIFTLSNYGVNSIWESTDGGVNWTTLDNSSLPDMPIRYARFLPAAANPGSRVTSAGGILLATELGVWSTSNISGTGTVWMPNNTGMGNVRVDRIDIRSSDNTIGVATHGRGVFTGTFISPLPINLTTFTGHLNDQNVTLNWQTASEQNAKDFELEKSTDGSRYRKIGTVPAKGNSFTTLNYEYNDQDVHELNYYRLRMNDKDGKSRLSSVVVIKNSGIVQKIRIVNPFKNEIDVSFTKSPGQVKLTLYSLSGVKIAEKSFPGTSDFIQWKLTDKLINKGIYLLNAIVDQETHTYKIYKNE